MFQIENKVQILKNIINISIVNLFLFINHQSPKSTERGFFFYILVNKYNVRH